MARKNTFGLGLGTLALGGLALWLLLRKKSPVSDVRAKAIATAVKVPTVSIPTFNLPSF